MKEKVYAVVDLETTAPMNKGGKIIQIGIVLVKKDKIISTYETDVNPKEIISNTIVQLTGISHCQLFNAPSFKDIAEKVFELLFNTVFVAHNIHFDYHFLNAQLKEAGFPELDNQKLDTVELAKIFFPTASSFRLSKLTKKLNIKHNHPHQAGGDAYATAELLLKIKKKIAQMPNETLEKIVALTPALNVDNAFFIKELLLKRREKIACSAEQILVNGLVLQKQEVETYHEEERVLDFPYSQKDKIALFTQELTFKKDQGRYANLVYKFFRENSKTCHFFLEATPGIGKSIGYLFPMSFYATREKPLIVSTSSTFLQQQLLKEAVPLINKVIPYKLKGTLVKAKENYIDLAAFARTLDPTFDQNQFVVYQMAVLVWLLETKTGDLDELAQKNESHLFFKQIAHKGMYSLNAQNSFYEVDFLKLQEKRIKNSNLLLTTHDFLVQDYLCKTPLLPASDGLILDEAHQLPSILQKATQVSLNLMQILRNIKLLTNRNTGLLNLYPVDSLSGILLDISFLISSMLEKIDLGDEHKQNFEFRDDFLLKEKENLKTCLAGFGKIYKNFEKTLKSELSLEQLVRYEDIDEVLLSILQDLLNLIFLIEAKGSQYSKDISWSKEENVPLLQMVDFSVNSLIENNWRRRYPKILYTSATLTTWKYREFLPENLQLTNYEVKKINSSDSKKKEELINVYLPLIHGLAYENIEILSDFLKEVIYTNKRRILVLFSDLDSLTEMYHYFYKLARVMGYELFAQTISGRKEKLVQRFLTSESALLFGADAFWGGIDLPAGALDIVIIMRIPLDYKKKKRNLDFANYLEEKGKDPFQDYFLPNAAMLLRQAFARLMRSNGKRAAFIFLDHRIRVKKYSRILENALPQGITFLVENTTKTIKALDKHLVL